jgi:WD40 repeat protein
MIRVRPVTLVLLWYALAFAQVPSQPELVLQTGHTNAVVGLAFSADGRRLFSAGLDQTVRSWDLGTGLELQSTALNFDLTPLTLNFGAFGLSDDGTILAVGGLGAVSILDTSTGTVKTRLEASTSLGRTILSPDGRIAATVRRLDTEIGIWDVEKGSLTRRISIQSSPFTNIAFSGNGRFLVSTSPSGVLSVLDAGTGVALRTLKGHAAVVTNLCTCGRGTRIVSSGMDKTVRVWDVETGTSLAEFPPGQTVLKAVCTADGRKVATFLGDSNRNTVKVWDTESGREVKTIVSKRPVGALAFSSDANELAIGQFDGEIDIFPIGGSGAERRLGSRLLLDDPLMTINSDGNIRLTERTSRRSVLWDFHQGRPMFRKTQGIASPDARWWVEERRSDSRTTTTFTLWNADTTREERTLGPFEVEPGALDLFAFSNDSGRLAVSVAGPKVRIISIPDGKELRELEVPETPSNYAPSTTRREPRFVKKILRFSPDNRFLVHANLYTLSSSNILLWDLKKASAPLSLTVTPLLRDVSFSPDSLTLAIAGNGALLWRPTWEKETQIAVRLGPPSANLVSFTTDGSRVVIGTPGDLSLWDISSGRNVALLRGADRNLSTVLSSPDGKWLFSAGKAGIQVWDLVRSEPVCTLVIAGDSDDWLAVTRNGLFDGSEGGMQKLVTWRIRNRVYPADRFFADFYTPGLIGRLLGGERPDPSVDLASLKLPPDVRIVAPVGNSNIAQSRTIVTVDVSDQGGGLQEVRLFQNGKLVGRQDPYDQRTYRFEVDLVPGENSLKAVAVSKDSFESNQDSIRVLHPVPDPGKPALHILAVGINQYEDRSLDLGFARADAEAIARFFEERGKPLFGELRATRLVDKQATRAGILTAFERVAAAARPEDVVVVYFAGHGVGIGQQFYFLPHDMRKGLDDEEMIRKYGIAAPAIGEALRRIPALKQVLILDTCQAETALPILAKAIRIRDSGEKAAKMLARSAGVYLIAAATKRQYAIEVPELGHGVLAYAVLSALGEKRPSSVATKDGLITMFGLLQFVNDQVPELTEKYHGGLKQYPVVFSTGMDFPLVLSPAVPSRTP